MNAAQSQGYQDFWKEAGLLDNPYDVQDQPAEYVAWEEGYLAAYEDYQQAVIDYV